MYWTMQRLKNCERVRSCCSQSESTVCSNDFGNRNAVSWSGRCWFNNFNFLPLLVAGRSNQKYLVDLRGHTALKSQRWAKDQPYLDSSKRRCCTRPDHRRSHRAASRAQWSDDDASESCQSNQAISAWSLYLYAESLVKFWFWIIFDYLLLFWAGRGQVWPDKF